MKVGMRCGYLRQERICDEALGIDFDCIFEKSLGAKKLPAFALRNQKRCEVAHGGYLIARMKG